MIDWVHVEAETWGRQMRWTYLGKDGWPSRTMLGKLIEEGVVGASASKMSQHFPECLNADAVQFNNVYKTMGEDDRLALFVHYVVVGKGKVKAHRMGIPVRTYYDRLDRAHKAYASAQHRLHKIVPFRATRKHEETVGSAYPSARSA